MHVRLPAHRAGSFDRVHGPECVEWACRARSGQIRCRPGQFIATQAALLLVVMTRCELSGDDSFLNRHARLRASAKKINIKNPGESYQAFLGFYVDSFQDACFAVDRCDSPEGAFHLFNDDLPIFEGDKNDPELVLLKSLARTNPIGKSSLNQVKIPLPTIL